MRPIFDPELVPVVAAGPVLPPAPAARLTAEGLRQQFAAPPPWEVEMMGDRAGAGGAPAQAAAVLIPIVLHPQPTVLLTRRTAHLKAHAGQISFPGGRIEPHDFSPEAAALREAHEEVGLPAERVELLGRLPQYTTVTGFAVTPVVGLVMPPLQWHPDPQEVDEVFEPPLHWLMNPAHHQLRAIEAAGQRHQFFAMPWQREPQATPPDEALAAARNHYFIWGATAAMLRNLYRFLCAPA